MIDTDTTDAFFRRVAAAIMKHEPELLAELQAARPAHDSADDSAASEDISGRRVAGRIPVEPGSPFYPFGRTRQTQARGVIAQVAVIRTLIDELKAVFDGCGDELAPLPDFLKSKIRDADFTMASITDHLLPQAHPGLSALTRGARQDDEERPVDE